MRVQPRGFTERGRATDRCFAAEGNSGVILLQLFVEDREERAAPAVRIAQLEILGLDQTARVELIDRRVILRMDLPNDLRRTRLSRRPDLELDTPSGVLPVLVAGRPEHREGDALG